MRGVAVARGASLSAVDDDLQPAADSGNLLLPTPAAYEELLASRAEPGLITIVRYGAPWCHSCRRIALP